MQQQQGLQQQLVCEEDGVQQDPRVSYLIPFKQKIPPQNHKRRVLLLWLTCLVIILAVSVLLFLYRDALIHEYKSNHQLQVKAHDKVEGVQNNTSANNSAINTEYQWALLVAGSNQWWNYRHQADVCHAYQVLRSGGLQSKRIIVMMYDDIANNENNPYPGKIFNRPYGADVYHGVSKDYVGEQVSKQNLWKAFGQGLQEEQKMKVLSSGEADRIFFYFTDHGGPGFIQMPNGDLVFADELRDLLVQLYKNNRFGEMVIYLEACNAGSMFQGMLAEELPIYVTTASDAEESSWACYCPGVLDDAAPPEFTTCLGDLYSVSWMENSEEQDLSQESLKRQYELVKLRTSKDFTYQRGSHVLQFGNMSIEEEVAGEYLGMDNTGEEEIFLHSSFNIRMDQRYADLMPLIIKYQSARGPEKDIAQAKLLSVVQSRRKMDSAIRQSVSSVSDHLSQKNSPVTFQLQSLMQFREQFFTSALGRANEQPIVEDWECYRGMVYGWQQRCGKLDSHGIKYGYVWVNLCNAGVTPDQYLQTLDLMCQNGTLTQKFHTNDDDKETINNFIQAM